MRRHLEELIGSSFGAAAGSGRASLASRAAMQGAVNRSADYQRLLGQEAARFQALYAQGQANSQTSCTTSTVNPLYPPWMHEAPQWVQRKVEKEIQERLDEPEQEELYDSVSPGSTYRPIELETHEDFAAKLASRGGANGSTQESLSVRNFVSPEDHKGRDGK